MHVLAMIRPIAVTRMISDGVRLLTALFLPLAFLAVFSLAAAPDLPGSIGGNRAIVMSAGTGALRLEAEADSLRFVVEQHREDEGSCSESGSLSCCGIGCPTAALLSSADQLAASLPHKFALAASPVRLEARPPATFRPPRG